jgi:threonine synthase
VVEVRGFFDEILPAARELARRGTHALVNSLNPYRIEGQKTAAFEIMDELGAPPDAVALPYGGGGNTKAYFRRFDELAVGAAATSGDSILIYRIQFMADTARPFSPP